MEMVSTIRQLHARGPACRGLAVDLDGVVLGRDHVLVRRSSKSYKVDWEETAQLLNLAFGGQWTVSG